MKTFMPFFSVLITVTGCLLTSAGSSLASSTPTAPGFELCLTYPDPGEFELWIRNGGADHAGLAGFSATLSGDVASFEFDPLSAANPDQGLTGFDVLGAGRTENGYNVYGAQTRRPMSRPIFGITLQPMTVPGPDGPVNFGKPLRIGRGTFTGSNPPMLDAASVVGNAFDANQSGQTFASLMTTCCQLIQGDQDGDGLPDCWELEHFGDPTRANPHEDSDGDGSSNAEEMEMGTDPRVPNQPLIITSIRHVEGHVELTFPTEPFREYRVQFTAQLGPDKVWTDLGSPVMGHGLPATFRDPSPDSTSRFYRVSVRQP